MYYALLFTPRTKQLDLRRVHTTCVHREWAHEPLANIRYPTSEIPASTTQHLTYATPTLQMLPTTCSMMVPLFVLALTSNASLSPLFATTAHRL